MRILLWLTLVIVFHGCFDWLYNLPKTVGDDVPEGKLNSLSFAPFREGQSPLEAIFPNAAQIEEDVKLLAEKTHSIRTYSSGETMVYIAPLAQKYGLKMIQGAWLGYMEVDNRKEIDALIKAANAYPEVIQRVIVGNEILLRGEMEPEKLIESIREVKRSVKQPVSYADVWSMYMKHPELIKEVDFITIHILPYWEDEPIPVNEAPAHIERIYKQVQKEAESIAPGKPILIGESGWPSVGRQRGWAVPSVVNEAQFIRGLIKVAQDNHFDYNIVEAFNQSWKSELEGVVGANWGLFSIDRKEVFPLTGKVYQNPKWLGELQFSSAILIFLAGCYWKRLQTLPTVPLILFLIFAQILAELFVQQCDYAWYTSYTPWQRLQAALIALMSAILAGFILHRACGLLADQSANRIVASATQLIYAAICLLALYITYQLALNGRYISFPFTLTSVAVIGVVGLAVLRLSAERSFSSERFNLQALIGSPSPLPKTKLWGYALLLISAALILGEIRAFMVGRDFIQAYPELATRTYWAAIFTLSNQQLMTWLLSLIVLAMPLLLSRQNAKLPK